jgi:hypothetical protein
VAKNPGARGTDNRAANVLVTLAISTFVAPTLGCCMFFAPAIAAVGVTPLWIAVVFTLIAWLGPPAVVLFHNWHKRPNTNRW